MIDDTRRAGCDEVSENLPSGWGMHYAMSAKTIRGIKARQLWKFTDDGVMIGRHLI